MKETKKTNDEIINEYFDVMQTGINPASISNFKWTFREKVWG